MVESSMTRAERRRRAANRTPSQACSTGGSLVPESITITNDAALHPAAEAWARLGNTTRPARIEIIKEKKTSAVYRLIGVDNGADVIVKRRSRAAAHGLRVEQTLYDEILPYMGVACLRSLGLIDGPDDGSWLFTEDAGPLRYSPESPLERRALGSWLGVLHTQGTVIASAVELPDRGPEVFRAYLADGTATILQHLGNAALYDDERSTLHEVLRLLDIVDARWSDIEEFCAALPRVLVHGDLIARNVCVRVQDGTPQIMPIDWEKAGWGIASIDLAQSPLPSKQFAGNADPEAYCAAIRHVWPHLKADMFRHSAWYATIFRCLAAVHWDAPYLRLSWPHRTMKKIEYYRSALRLACEHVGIGGGAR
jgi:hypothetical protein